MAEQHSGAMVALIPTNADANRLAVDGGEPADQLHVTLSYLGDAGDIDDTTRQAITTVVTDAVATLPPAEGDGFAVALFNPHGDEPCVVLGLSGDDLDTVHAAVTAALDGVDLPDQHKPWIPHLTLAYTDDTSMAAQLVDRTGPVTFDRVRVVFAGAATDIPLTPADPDGDDVRAAFGGTLLHARSNPMPEDTQPRLNVPDEPVPVRLGENGPQIGRARAYIDRESLAPGSRLRFVAANEGVMADGIDLRMTGARLDRYRANPVIGFGHNYYGRANLPIGRAVNTEVAGPRMLMDVEMDMGDPFAVEVDRKIRAGYLSAMSIGFEVTRWQDGKGSYWEGGVAEEWELTESSVVPIPMDAGALCVGGRAALTDDIDRAWLRVMVDEFGLDRVMGVFGPLPSREVITVGAPIETPSVPPEPEPPAVEHLVARVDEQALAQAIRAAFIDLLPAATAPAGDSPTADDLAPEQVSDIPTPDSAARAADIDPSAARDLLAAFNL